MFRHTTISALTSRGYGHFALFVLASIERRYAAAIYSWAYQSGAPQW